MARATAPGIVLVLVLVLVLWERVHPVGWSFSRLATVFLSDVQRSRTSTRTIRIPGAVALAAISLIFHFVTHLFSGNIDSQPTAGRRSPGPSLDGRPERQHGLAVPTAPVNYAHTDWQNASSDSFSVIRNSCRRDHLPRKNVWPRKSAQDGLLVGAESHDLRRCGRPPTGLPETNPIHRI